MPLIRDYEELEVYRLALKLQQEIFEITKHFPREEMYSLTDQVRRSSRAIGENIAEAWAKRRYVAHFISKLTDADGEQLETRHWLKTAFLCGYLDESQFEYLTGSCKQVGGKIGNMIKDARQWCF